jgi:hypothetical protein
MENVSHHFTIAILWIAGYMLVEDCGNETVTEKLKL